MKPPPKNPAVPPETLPDTFELPPHWTTEQALAVWECLNALTHLVWERYQTQLLEHLKAELDTPNTNQLDLFDPDDEIPF